MGSARLDGSPTSRTRHQGPRGERKALPGKPNNQKQMDVSPNSHFLCKDVNCHNGNNHLFLVVWVSRYILECQVMEPPSEVPSPERLNRLHYDANRNPHPKSHAFSNVSSLRKSLGYTAAPQTAHQTLVHETLPATLCSSLFLPPHPPPKKGNHGRSRDLPSQLT